MRRVVGLFVIGHRPDREDVSKQLEACAVAREALADALEKVCLEAALTARQARSKAKRPQPVDLTLFHAARVAVERAEADVDHAARDLASASGENV